MPVRSERPARFPVLRTGTGHFPLGRYGSTGTPLYDPATILNHA